MINNNKDKNIKNKYYTMKILRAYTQLYLFLYRLRRSLVLAVFFGLEHSHRSRMWFSASAGCGRVPTKGAPMLMSVHRYWTDSLRDWIFIPFHDPFAFHL